MGGSRRSLPEHGGVWLGFTPSKGLFLANCRDFRWIYSACYTATFLDGSTSSSSEALS